MPKRKHPNRPHHLLCLLILLAPVLPGCPFAPERELTLYKPDLACNGITLFGILGQPEFFDLSHGYLNAIRMAPETPGTNRIEPIWEYGDGFGGQVTDTKLLPNGHILTVRGRPFGDKIMEIDPVANEIVWTYDEVAAHHDADLLPDGNIMFLYRTIASDPTWGEMIVDGIRIVDRDKNILWDWNLYEHDPAGNPVPEEECPPQTLFALPEFDWSHCNALTLVPDRTWRPGRRLQGAIYLNCRNFSRIYKIRYDPGHPRDGEILWILGDRTDPPFGEGLFSHAHDPEYSFEIGPRGKRITRILLFDNGLCRPTGPCPPDEAPCPPDLDFYSRVLEIRIDNENDPARRSATITWKWPSPGSPTFPEERFYSNIMSDADRLPNGNVLITSATEGGSIFDIFHPSHARLVEVRRDGTLTGAEKVWEMRIREGYAVYRAQRIREENWPLP